MNCRICGHPNNDDMRFCTNCGAELEAPPAQQPEQNEPQPVSQQSEQQQYQQPGQQQYPQYGQQQYQQPGQQQYQQYGQQQYPQYGQQPYQQYPQYRPYKPLPKKGISKHKTPFFWISKAVLIIAIVTFMFPFMKMSAGKKYPSYGSGLFPNMTGKELVFGVEDEDQKEKSDLTNIYVQISAGLLVVALCLPQISHFFSGASTIFLVIFIKYADHSYTYGEKGKAKPLYELNDMVRLKFQPALYVCIALLVIATVISVIDDIKRRKLFDEEQKLLADNQDSSSYPTGRYI